MKASRRRWLGDGGVSSHLGRPHGVASAVARPGGGGKLVLGPAIHHQQQR